MITDFKKSETRDSAIIYKTTWEQIKDMHGMDKELAGELAISAFEIMLTGDISSDNPMIRLILRDMEHMSVKNKVAHDKSVETKRQARITKMKLDTIAELLLDGKSQKAIAAALNESQQTISNRVKIIREEYPELLEEENQKNQKNPTNQIHVNVNVNDNENVNENENVTSPSARSGVNPTPQCSPAARAIAEQKKEFNF